MYALVVTSSRESAQVYGFPTKELAKKFLKEITKAEYESELEGKNHDVELYCDEEGMYARLVVSFLTHDDILEFQVAEVQQPKGYQ